MANVFAGIIAEVPIIIHFQVVTTKSFIYGRIKKINGGLITFDERKMEKEFDKIKMQLQKKIRKKSMRNSRGLIVTCVKNQIRTNLST